MKTLPVRPCIKSITIEARPMWETKRNLLPYLSEQSMDMQRIRKYKEVKEVFDTYARKVIEIATQNVADEQVTPTYENLRTLFYREKDAKTRALYKKASDNYKKFVASVIKKTAENYQLTKKFGKLFSENDSAIRKNAAILGMKEENLKVLSLYNNFSSFFTKYFTSLTTIICGTEQGSIAFRILENMERYWQNEQVLTDIEENYPELFGMIRDAVDEIELAMCMTQEGIDHYRFLLGNIHNDGINSKISEFAQKNSVCIKLLKPLYKIPLAKEEKQIVITAIDSDEEFRNVVLDSLTAAEQILAFAKRVKSITFDEKVKETTYVKYRKVT